MSAGQVERLQALLSRVQANRDKPRAVRAPAQTTAAPVAAVLRAAVPPPTAAAPMAASPMAAHPPVREPSPAAALPRGESGGVVEERVNIPDRVSLPQRPATAARPATQPVARESMSQDAARSRPARDRTATPLEMAVEGELNRPTAEMAVEGELNRPTAEPAAAPRPASRATTSATERLMPAVSAASSDSGQYDAAEADLEMPLTLEPQPVIEPQRPIAQVVSKHAPQLDATFGAMLKRSLSLRPH